MIFIILLYIPSIYTGSIQAPPPPRVPPPQQAPPGAPRVKGVSVRKFYIIFEGHPRERKPNTVYPIYVKGMFNIGDNQSYRSTEKHRRKTDALYEKQ